MIENETINVKGLLAGYLKEIGKYPSLTAEEEAEIWRNKTPENINRLINSDLRLVVMIVNKIIPYRAAKEQVFMDLIQAGNMGLMEAIEKFDPSKGVRFITHAYNWIRMRVREEASNQKCGLIQKPIHILKAFGTITKMENRLEGILGRKPTEEELKVSLHGIFSEEKLEELLNIKNLGMLSLDMKTSNGSDDSESLLMDYIVDKEADERVTRKDISDALLIELKSVLPPKLYFLVCARFGLDEFHGDEKTLSEIGKLFAEKGMSKHQLTKERVRQMEAKAIAIIKSKPEILEIFRR